MRFVAALLASLIGGFPAVAAAQADFPSKPIQVVVGYPPGGNTDSLARTLAQEARKIFNREVIVINRPGAGGALGMVVVSAAAPDGYMLGIATSSSLTTAPHLQDVPMDLIERTTSLISLGRPQQGIAVRGDSPIRSVRDLIEQARRNPGNVSIGLQGLGSGSSMVLHSVALDEKVQMNFIAFKGDAPAVTDLLGGHITAVGTSAFSFERFVSAGNLRAIASLDDSRLPFAPNVPTLIEQGHPYQVAVIFYLLGPKGLPAPIVKRLVEVFGEASNTPAYVEGTAKNGVDRRNTMTGETLERFLLDDRTKIGSMVKRLGMKRE